MMKMAWIIYRKKARSTMKGTTCSLGTRYLVTGCLFYFKGVNTWQR